MREAVRDVRTDLLLIALVVPRANAPTEGSQRARQMRALHRLYEEDRRSFQLLMRHLAATQEITEDGYFVPEITEETASLEVRRAQDKALQLAGYEPKIKKRGSPHNGSS